MLGIVIKMLLDTLVGLGQGILTEGEGLAQLTSSLRYLALKERKNSIVKTPNLN
jgi:hypothetical protein